MAVIPDAARRAESRKPEATNIILAAPGFRLALRASGMTVESILARGEFSKTLFSDEKSSICMTCIMQ
ncbi:MAG: hypothetical protein B7Y90_13420 [Alphaproteobacteria bacterium 32-64-14]|nr:MAG: hypothetical protein B7Y90_13420 [Alphaproteobacteria bacterium 32-64-14]